MKKRPPPPPTINFATASATLKDEGVIPGEIFPPTIGPIPRIPMKSDIKRLEKYADILERWSSELSERIETNEDTIKILREKIKKARENP